jgi:hypothetical protein
MLLFAILPRVLLISKCADSADCVIFKIYFIGNFWN